MVEQTIMDCLNHKTIKSFSFEVDGGLRNFEVFSDECTVTWVNFDGVNWIIVMDDSKNVEVCRYNTKYVGHIVWK